MKLMEGAWGEWAWAALDLGPLGPGKAGAWDQDPAQGVQRRRSAKLCSHREETSQGGDRPATEPSGFGQGPQRVRTIGREGWGT